MAVGMVCVAPRIVSTPLRCVLTRSAVRPCSVWGHAQVGEDSRLEALPIPLFRQGDSEMLQAAFQVRPSSRLPPPSFLPVCLLVFTLSRCILNST